MGDKTVTVCGTTRPGQGTITKLVSRKDERAAKDLIFKIDVKGIFRAKPKTLWKDNDYRIDYQGPCPRELTTW